MLCSRPKEMVQSIFVTMLTSLGGKLLRCVHAYACDCMCVMDLDCLIQALYTRECQRADQGAARMVPRLRVSHFTGFLDQT